MPAGYMIKGPSNSVPDSLTPLFPYSGSAGAREGMETTVAIPSPVVGVLAAAAIAVLGGMGATSNGTPHLHNDFPTPTSITVACDVRRRPGRTSTRRGGTTQEDAPGVLIRGTDEAITVAERIASVREHLSLSMTHLAQALRISRPTLYAWQRGQVAPRSIYLERLKDLSDVAHEWRNYGLKNLGSSLVTPLADRRSLLDLLSDPVWDRRSIQNALVVLRDAQERTQRRRSERNYRSVADVLAQFSQSEQPAESSDLALRIEERRLRAKT
jgi:transcriptional regulator with XRE-family HTH domain